MTIQPFDFNGAELRATSIDDDPYFFIGDACAVLGIANVGNAIARLDPADIRTVDVWSEANGRNYQSRVVNEAGLYDLILDSRKPEARAFRRWITSEVLPTIRKTGTYSTAPALPQTYKEALLELVAKVEENERLTEQIAQLEPKADLADNYLTAKPNGRLLREVAKAFGMRERDLRGFLLEEKLIFTRQSLCGSVVYDFKAEFRPHFEARETVVNHSWGTCQHYTLYITPQGVGLIRKRIADRKAAVIGAQS